MQITNNNTNRSYSPNFGIKISHRIADKFSEGITRLAEKDGKYADVMEKCAENIKSLYMADNRNTLLTAEHGKIQLINKFIPNSKPIELGEYFNNDHIVDFFKNFTFDKYVKVQKIAAKALRNRIEDGAKVNMEEILSAAGADTRKIISEEIGKLKPLAIA